LVNAFGHNRHGTNQPLQDKRAIVVAKAFERFSEAIRCWDISSNKCSVNTAQRVPIWHMISPWPKTTKAREGHALVRPHKRAARTFARQKLTRPAIATRETEVKRSFAVAC